MSRARLLPCAGACADCARRSWLLAELVGPLEYCARDRSRLSALLALEDAQLLAALGGRRRAELEARHRRFDPRSLRDGAQIDVTCRHRPGFPRALASAQAPRMLHVAGTAARLRELTAAPVVAIVGSSRPSDYGLELAHELGRGLAASGVTVLAALADGVARAAHEGALEARAGLLALIGGGLDVTPRVRDRALYEEMLRCGCAISEFPCGARARRAGQVAGERILAELAQLTLVVEADERPGELAVAKLAAALGRPVAALPGRVSSPLSRGCNALLREGASLVRGSEDVLELLDTPASRRPLAPGPCAREAGVAGLSRRQRATLEQVGRGRDTAALLGGQGADPWTVLAALSELEVMGLLRRGHGGRYVLVRRGQT